VRRGANTIIRSARPVREGGHDGQDCGSLFVLRSAARRATQVNTVTEGLNHAKAVETDLERSTGLKPRVSFNWNNGRLRSVTVTYPRLKESRLAARLGARHRRQGVQAEAGQYRALAMGS
jgi:hypothetical protein